MAKMSKIMRMGDAESLLAEATADSMVSEFNDISTAIEAFEDARSEAESSFAEAAGYHEEREWESRNDSLTNASDLCDAMSEALDTLEDKAVYLKLNDEIEGWRKLVADIREHLDNLIEV